MVVNKLKGGENMRYVKPEMEIQEFRMTDMILTSGDDMNEGGTHEEGTGGGSGGSVDFG